MLGCRGCDARQNKTSASGSRAGMTGDLPGDTERAASWVKESALLANIPASARSVIVAKDLQEATRALNFGAKNLNLDALSGWRERWQEAGQVDLFDPEALARAGVSSERPVLIFYDRGYWVFQAEVEDHGRMRGAVDAFKNELIRAAEQTDPADSAALAVNSVEESRAGNLDNLKIDYNEDGLAWLSWDRRRLLFATRVAQTDLNSRDTSLPLSWRGEAPTANFIESAGHRKLFQELSPHGNIVGVARPAAWMADIEAQGHAQLLLKRMISQIGPIGAAVSAPDWQEAIELRVLTPGNPRAPAVVADLGRAEGELSTPEGLFAPGVLALGRMSIDPRQLYTLLVSVLPADEREQLQIYWDELDRELRIDALGDVLDNLSGHAVFVAYGLEIDDEDSLKEHAPGWRLLSTLTLQNTREALLFKLKAREPMETTLDALTAITKGKLSRQRAGDTLQYAWLEDGALKWALLLGDDYLIYVDSAVAFEHARAFERGERSMPDELSALGVERLFEPQYSAGFYADSASVGAILEESGLMDGGARSSLGWLRAFRSISLTTGQPRGSQTGITHVYLEVATSD